MTQDKDIDLSSNNVLEDIARDLFALAEKHQTDRLYVLALLRDLEQIHRYIRVNFFEAPLPQSRNDLYQLVKDIEEKGGWPYIERMRLKELLQNIEQTNKSELE